MDGEELPNCGIPELSAPVRLPGSLRLSAGRHVATGEYAGLKVDRCMEKPKQVWQKEAFRLGGRRANVSWFIRKRNAHHDPCRTSPQRLVSCPWSLVTEQVPHLIINGYHSLHEPEREVLQRTCVCALLGRIFLH